MFSNFSGGLLLIAVSKMSANILPIFVHKLKLLRSLLSMRCDILLQAVGFLYNSRRCYEKLREIMGNSEN
ncbi:MAG: hypothetical protein COA42_02910 [Alteromonadaceae bacterium]|nr:MAG: hypothetical protein COA42_02910 [Alteromonadaceae bacterium]